MQGKWQTSNAQQCSACASRAHCRRRASHALTGYEGATSAKRRVWINEPESHLCLVTSIDGPIVFGLHGREQEHLHWRPGNVTCFVSSIGIS